MAKIVICNFNLFDMYHAIELIDTNKDNKTIVATAATTEDLGRTIAEFCYAEKANEIHLIGHTEYAREFLSDEILTNAKTNYGLDNLNIYIKGVK